MLATVLAGRRIDADGAEIRRFPLERVETVRSRIAQAMLEYAPDWLVSSAACGSDLVAQEVARELGIARRVVLPCEPVKFRQTSVIDRPGDWGPIFDRVIRDLDVRGNVINLQLDPHAHDWYGRVNEAILEHGLALADGAVANVQAMVVWEGQSRGPNDYTAEFEAAARQRGMTVRCVPTT